MMLAADEGLAGLALRFERVELPARALPQRISGCRSHSVCGSPQTVASPPFQRRPGSCYARRCRPAVLPGTGTSGRRAMNLSRRDLAPAAGVFALGAAAFAGPVLA